MHFKMASSAVPGGAPALPPRPQPSGYYYLAVVRSLRHVATLLLEVLSDKLGDQCPRGSQQVAL